MMRVGGVLASLATAIALFAAPSAAAATYVVNTTADSPPATPECGGAPADCSLRQALDRAVSGDTVVVPASTVPYAIVDEKIAVAGGVAIRGAGSLVTTVDGGGRDQAFDLLGGAPVTVSGLTLAHMHNDSGSEEGGAINGQAAGGDPLALEDVAIVESDTPSGFGGAIEVNGDLSISDSRFEADSAGEGGGGGAVDVVKGGAAVSISDSVFSGDSTVAGGGGALLVETKDSLTVTSSTFAGNVAGGGRRGGAIDLLAGSTATVINSTFTANAAGEGGGLSSEGKSLALLNDTVAGNAAEVGANLNSKTPLGGTTTENTILATPTGGGGNCAGKTTSLGHNFEDASPSTCGLGASDEDQIGGPPGLSALADNSSIVPAAGGPPQTLALVAGSREIGAGDPSGCQAAGSVDERGFPRPGLPGHACDIGAYELLAPVATATALSSSSARPALGQPVTLTATVTATGGLPPAVPGPQGMVVFRDGAGVLGAASLGAGGQATLVTSSLAVGAHAITAGYAGDAVHTASGSAQVTVTAVAAPPPGPQLSHVGQSHTSWREGSRSATLARRSHHSRRPPVGTTFKLTLNTAASVKLTFARSVAGRRVHGRCVGRTRPNRRARRCTRTVGAGTLVFANAHAGANRIAFQGRLGHGARLRPGRYTVTIVATNAGGRSPAKRLAFTIVAA